jgi:ADP-ribose pyrophosphatase YjhB (NUDIX family)/quercetin dioxygenase-like cupin family protein
MAFRYLDATAIQESLQAVTRQYLVGQLSRPQKLAYIEDTDLEIGITRYERADVEAPHWHQRAKEYQYVLSGLTEYRDLGTGESHRYATGDFYVIYPGTIYAQRSKRDTAILFIKFPPGNDKVNVDTDELTADWMRKALRVERLDLKAGSTTPRPNSLRPAVAVAVVNENRDILLVQRADSGKWSMPGGVLELNEDIEGCAIREVKEETGLEIKVEGLVGTYTNPDVLIAYSDREIRREFTIVVAARAEVGELAADSESTKVAWVQLEQALDLPMAPSQQRRITDYLEFEKTGRALLR